MTLLDVETLEVHKYFWDVKVFLTRFQEDKAFIFHAEDVPRTILKNKDGLRIQFKLCRNIKYQHRRSLLSTRKIGNPNLDN